MASLYGGHRAVPCGARRGATAVREDKGFRRQHDGRSLELGDGRIQ